MAKDEISNTEISDDARRQLGNLMPGLSRLVERLWQRHVPAEISRGYRDPPTNLQMLVDRYSQHLKCTHYVAIVELAYLGDLLSSSNRHWLLRELGAAESDRTAKSPLPDWDPRSGELRLGRKVIRKLRIMKSPSQLQLVVELFERNGWSTSVQNDLGLDPGELGQVVYELNRNLGSIRFHSQAGGREIRWSYKSKPK